MSGVQAAARSDGLWVSVLLWFPTSPSGGNFSSDKTAANWESDKSTPWAFFLARVKTLTANTSGSAGSLLAVMTHVRH
ncbi:unnamed protein product [Lota lota]